MSNTILKEMHQLSHEDDLRYLLLMRGMKQLLEERKRNRKHIIKRIRYLKKLNKVQARKWS
ncbi:hypothetical protein B2I21_27435 [Chryseobacterium mucoviscidosis]|nr:hypothetical protein B2I21_27435 [Chryseobacterium mucoviscidosis]